MIELITILASGILWRLRGIMGWPFTMLFAIVQAGIVAPILGKYALLYGLWIMVGELSGWKPKLIWDDGDWWKASAKGFLIGGVGAIAVPLSTWLARVIPEPQIKALQNPHWFKLPFWSSKKQLLNWCGSWNEMYMGAIFSFILQLGAALRGGV
jgi:hypothetical protein